MTPRRPPLIAVCGGSEATAADLAIAEECGSLLGGRGAVVLCGGLGGVMGAAARGARSAGGACIGLLPGDDPDDAADDVTVAIPTGLGEMRNALIARACAGMVAIGGGYGTLSEVALALRLSRPVAGLGTWELRAPKPIRGPGLRRCEDPAEAVTWVLHAAARHG